jgi:hypothetical protein
VAPTPPFNPSHAGVHTSSVSTTSVSPSDGRRSAGAGLGFGLGFDFPFLSFFSLLRRSFFALVASPELPTRGRCRGCTLRGTSRTCAAGGGKQDSYSSSSSSIGAARDVGVLWAWTSGTASGSLKSSMAGSFSTSAASTTSGRRHKPSTRRGGGCEGRRRMVAARRPHQVDDFQFNLLNFNCQYMHYN